MPVLDRIPYFDERSRGFAMRPLLGPSPVERRTQIWTPRADPLDQGVEGACFPAGTHVRMADGSHRPIEDVTLLDEVVTAEGRTGRVLRTMVREADDGLVEVSTRGHLPLRCTPGHPVLTRRGYVAARDLRRGDLVCLTRRHAELDTPIDVGALIDVRGLRGVIDGTVNTGGVTTTVAPLPTLLGRTPDLGRLIGLYAAEGHTTENKVVWSFGRHEEHTLAAETVRLIKTAFDAQARVQVRTNGAINVVLYGKTWRLLFETLVPGTSKHGDKHLSAHVTRGPVPFTEAILDGWLAGDGHARRTEIIGVTVCRRLALDMHAIAAAAGRPARLSGSAPSVNSHAATRQYRYEVAIPLGGGHNLPLTTDTATWRTVTAITPVEFEGWVYNLHVEGDESYVADGVGVHNCVGFAFAGELAAVPWTHSVDNAFARTLYERARVEDRAMGNNWPEGASLLAGAKACRARGYIAQYRWAFGIDDVIDTLITHGPVVLGINWYQGMYQTGPHGVLEVTGRRVGGHAIMANGYVLNHPILGGDMIMLTNSWGRRFGLRGVAYMRPERLAALLADRGEACVVTDTPVPAV